MAVFCHASVKICHFCFEIMNLCIILLKEGLKGGVNYLYVVPLGDYGLHFTDRHVLTRFVEYYNYDSLLHLFSVHIMIIILLTISIG